MIRRVAASLLEHGLNVDGFYTEEVREAGERTGFRVVALDGSTGRLAAVGGGGPRVGKYAVDVPDFEAVGVTALERAAAEADIIILDEIGKMELLSTAFRAALEKALDSESLLVGALGHADDPFVVKIANRPDVEVIKLTKDNRDSLIETILRRLRIQ